MQSMYYIYFLVIPLVAYMLIRTFRSRSKWKKDNAHFEAQALAQRLKLQIEKGEPTFNLVMTDRTMPGAPRTKEVVLRGTPYNHPFVISYYDERYTEEGLLERRHYHTFDSYLLMSTEADLPAFEIMNKQAITGSDSTTTTNLPEQLFGDTALDQHLLLKTADPVLGPKLAPLLGSLVSVPYVHLVSQGRDLRYIMTEIGMMTAMYQIDAIVYVMESVACYFEGKPVPGMLTNMTATDNPSTTGLPSTPSSAGIPVSQLSPSTQVPMPCKVCGAPMKEISSGALNEPVRMKCLYCDAEENLPAESLERVTALRARLAQMKWAQSAEQATAQAFAMVSERGLWIAPILLLLVYFGYQVKQAYDLIQNNSNQTAQTLGEILAGQGLMMGLMLGALFGVLAMFLTYRFSGRKTLLARPPLEPNHPMRCRQCGGDLPNQVGPFVTCAFCRAQNLVTQDIARNQAVLLDQEVKEYRRRAAEQAGEFKKTVSGAVNRYYVAIGAGVALGIGLYVLARFLLPHLL